MENIIFYTELDKIIGCTRHFFIKGEPFCDSCQGYQSFCSFKGQCMKDIQQMIKNEQQLKATFIKLYLEKAFRI
ncbi:MAG: hypothetical protein HWN66_07540 [Candidatus Helarchaeota archaeon]|nr:hypothetical protein [Candidatus Helarchaeota archaeon]